MMASDPLTLFFFCERVARLREAQRRCDDVDSAYNRRMVMPLAQEVDALLARASGKPFYPEFEKLLGQVGEMRRAQGGYSMVDGVQRLVLEKEVDRVLSVYASQARFLNSQLHAHNLPLNVPVIENNTQKRGQR